MSFPTKIGSSGSIRRFSATHRLVENARSLANSETCTLTHHAKMAKGELQYYRNKLYVERKAREQG